LDNHSLDKHSDACSVDQSVGASSRGSLSHMSMFSSTRRGRLRGAPSTRQLQSNLDVPNGQAFDERPFSKSMRDIRNNDNSFEMTESSDADPCQSPGRRNLTRSMHSGAASNRRLGDSLQQSLHRLQSAKGYSSNNRSRSPARSQAVRSAKAKSLRKIGNWNRDDMSTTSFDTSMQRSGAVVPYFEKLCWVCEQIDYPFEYADIVGSQFLSLDGASPVTHVDGHVPTMDELVEFLSTAFLCLVEYADLSVIFIDDFQWVDSFSWKIFRELCKRGDRILMMCAMRSHDKQALRRLSTAATRQNQLQSHMTEITLGHLDLHEIRDLMATVLGYDGASIPDALCTDIFQRTGGLPVYVVQVLENVKRKNTLENGDDGIVKWNAEGLKEKVSC
jgi:hypothetical protein